MSLRKKDFQDYMKRLRKAVSKRFPDAPPIRYYVAGEYGTKNKRPHYHAIVFNVPDAEMFFQSWSIGGTPIGSVHVGHVSGDSIAYTMKYIDKSSFSPGHSRDDRAKEFALMSKGLGKAYLTPDVVAYHRQSQVLYVTRLSGHRVSMPLIVTGKQIGRAHV